MKEDQHLTRESHKSLIKKCHSCGHLNESNREPERCTKCRKAFLPTNYFSKVHSPNSKDYHQLFSDVSELEDENLIIGLFVIW